MQQASPSQGLLPPPIRNKLAQAAQDALYIKRGELQDQLRDLTKRRAELQGQRAQMSATGGQAHDARIAVIDQRSAAIEKELFATNDLIAKGLPVVSAEGQFTYTAPPNAQGAARDAARNSSRGAGIGIASVLAIVILWRAAKSFFPKDRRPTALPDNSSQLTQLQQSMDAIAVEVERISEAQRYTAKVMNERGLGAGEAQPVAAAHREQVGAKPGRL